METPETSMVQTSSAVGVITVVAATVVVPAAVDVVAVVQAG